ncbi:MAG: universal stress protein [Alphaproteobacteria bacterium]
MQNETEMNKKGGVFLVVVDGTIECQAAVDYACKFANASGGYVALLNVMEEVVVQNWHNVEKRVKRELRDVSEQMVWDASGRVLQNTGKIPMICIEEGDRANQILETLQSNPNIVALVLAAAESSNPGPLVTYFAGKGLLQIPVPLMVIPGNLQPISNT